MGKEKKLFIVHDTKAISHTYILILNKCVPLSEVFHFKVVHHGWTFRFIVWISRRRREFVYVCFWMVNMSQMLHYKLNRKCSVNDAMGFVLPFNFSKRTVSILCLIKWFICRCCCSLALCIVYFISNVSIHILSRKRIPKAREHNKTVGKLGEWWPSWYKTNETILRRNQNERIRRKRYETKI